MSKRTITALIIVIGFCLSNTVLGFSWTTGYYDHGESPFDHNNNTAPIDYPYGVGMLPSPGNVDEGGEKYDLEGFFVAFDQDYMYVALTNSFGMSATSTTWGTTFRQGDIFFGYGGEKNTYAIDVSSGNLVDVDIYNYIQDDDGTYYDMTEIRNRVGAHEAIVNETFSTELGTANQIMTEYEGLEYNPMYAPEGPMDPDNTNGDTYVFEWKIDRSLLGWDGTSEIFFHTTLGCGNDLIEYTYGAVPEPGTMILLGLGLCGVGILNRRK